MKAPEHTRSRAGEGIDAAAMHKPVGAPRLHRAPGGAATPTSRAYAAVQRKPASSGEPLPDRSRYEAQLGEDLSAVKVHAGDGAAEQAGALAFARGDDIHLAAAVPSLVEHEGAALLGHELTHVIQQRRGGASSPAPQAKLAGPTSPRVDDASLEREADSIGARIAAGENVSGAITGQAPESVVQCFGAKEHKDAGDMGTDTRTYTWETAEGKQGGAYPFALTHGDIVMLSGDLFDPRDEKPDENDPSKTVPVEDSLFKLAARPSSNRGKQLGTQDEIVAAIYKDRKSHVNFEPGGMWHWAIDIDDKRHEFQKLAKIEQAQLELFGRGPKNGLSKEVKKSVSLRYLRLASENVEHFKNPTDTDDSGDVKLGDRHSAGGSYRALHEAALLRAYDLGSTGKNNGPALVREAAAQHFLTDEFAAGHVRTPRQDISKWWDDKVPGFHKKFVDYIVHRVGVGLNETTTNALTAVATIKRLQGNVRSSLNETLAGKPEAHIGHIIGLLAHDVDNEIGLNVINDFGDTWITYGDGHMDKQDDDHPDNRTTAMVVKAVKFGVEDIEKAYQLGTLHKARSMRAHDDIVKAHVRGGEDKYKPEKVVPRLYGSMDGDQQWKFESIDELWDLPIRTDKPDITWGKEIIKEVNSGQIGTELKDVLASQPEEDGPAIPKTNIKVHFWGFRVFPRRAFKEYFLDDLQNNTQNTLNAIINGSFSGPAPKDPGSDFGDDLFPADDMDACNDLDDDCDDEVD